MNKIRAKARDSDSIRKATVSYIGRYWSAMAGAARCAGG
jgi:hypothetical protein